MTVSIIVFLLVSNGLVAVYSFSNGAIESVCGDLRPGHGPSSASLPAPYSLTVSSSSYIPGQTLQVTLSGTGGAQFKGFLIAAKKAVNPTAENYGTFIASSEGKAICQTSLNSGITHTSPGVKSSVSFDWTAPPTSQGDLVFHYSVVRGGAPSTTAAPGDYYADLLSTVISGPPIPPGSVPNGEFVKDPECGQTKGCYHNCTNDVCDWLLSWKQSGSVFDFTFMSSAPSDDTYVALGFTATSGMFPASVLACRTQNSTIEAISTFNPSYSNTILSNPKEGISNENNSFVNGVLQCSFSRVTVSNDSNLYDLSQPYYLITARGNVRADGTLSKHTGDNRFLTNAKIDLTKATTDESFFSTTTTSTTSPGTATTTTAAPASKFRKDPRCGVSRGCYSNCEEECDLLLSWQKKGDNYEITLKSGFSGTGNHYIALGFCDTANAMSPASVVSCNVYQDQVDAYVSFNPGKYNEKLPNPKEGISNISGTYNNGVLECTFTREASSASNAQIFDLRKDWYLITARGEALLGGSLNQHSGKERYLTSSRINFADPSVDISLEVTEYPLIQAHACIMAIAWMLSASIGLGMARFFKKLWPDNKLCGVKIWFAVHRGSMVLAFVMGISAFVIIFVHVKGYSDVGQETYHKAHPILGIIVTGLLFINPFMSLLRCAPDHPRRPVFNYAHWAVGTSAHILAGVTITLGLYLPNANVDKDLGLIIMIVYGGWHVVFFIIMTILDCLSETQPSKTSPRVDQQVELSSVPPHSHSGGGKVMDVNISSSMSYSKQLDPNNGEPPNSSAKKLIFMCHAVILTGLTVFLIYLIISGNN